MKKSYRGGNLEKSQELIRKMRENKCSFTVVSGGQSKKILFQNKGETYKKKTYYGNAKSEHLPGVFMCSIVKKDIDSYIKNGNPIPQFKDKPSLLLYNFKEIEKICEADKTHLSYAIDINSCYFQTAYNLGFISKKTFDRGWKDRDIYKYGILASIGTLNKKEVIEKYVDGELVSTDYEEENYNKYSPFYWAIINEVNKIMNQIAELLGDDFYMWLTDCAVFKRGREKDVESFLDENNYSYKNFRIEYEKIDKRKIYWYDYSKAKSKYVNYHKRCGFEPDLIITK